MHAPESVPEADYVVIESTYGNRKHDRSDPIEALGAVIERTVHRGGTVVIPAFAVGRAQSLIYDLWRLRRKGRLPNIPTYLDSPMASSASDLMHAYPDDHRLSAQDYEAACEGITCVRRGRVEGIVGQQVSENRHFRQWNGHRRTRVLHHIAALAPTIATPCCSRAFRRPERADASCLKALGRPGFTVGG